MSEEEVLYEASLDQISIIVFEVGWEQFAIDLLDVKEIIQSGHIRRLPKGYDFIEGIYNYRGNIIHIINLKKKLSLDEFNLYKTKGSSIEGDTEKNFIIILNIDNTHIGFHVDRIIQVAHINPEKLIGLSPIFQTGISDVSYIRGIVKFDDRPRIFIDLRRVLSEAEQTTIISDQSQSII